MDWTRYPKGAQIAPNCAPLICDYGSAHIDGVGIVNANNHGTGWGASGSLYSLPCESQAEAEWLAEQLAGQLQVVQARLLCLQAKRRCEPDLGRRIDDGRSNVDLAQLAVVLEDARR